jgi:hypothetical protein
MKRMLSPRPLQAIVMLRRYGLSDSALIMLRGFCPLSSNAFKSTVALTTI